MPLIPRLYCILVEQPWEVVALPSVTSSVVGILIPPHRVVWKFWDTAYEIFSASRAVHKILLFSFSCLYFHSHKFQFFIFYFIFPQHSPLRALNLGSNSELRGNQNYLGYFSYTWISIIQGFESVVSLTDSRVKQSLGRIMTKYTQLIMMWTRLLKYSR